MIDGKKKNINQSQDVLSKLAVWLYGWQCWSVSQSTALAQTEISQQPTTMSSH